MPPKKTKTATAAASAPPLATIASITALRVPELRAQLTEHDIAFPAKAVKAELQALLALFTIDLLLPDGVPNAAILDKVKRWYAISLVELKVGLEDAGIEVGNRKTRWSCIQSLIEAE